MSNTERLWNTIEKLQQEVKVLRAELESGQSTWLDVLEANENLKAENKRLREAGDKMYRYVGKSAEHGLQVDKHDKSKHEWLAAKGEHVNE
jgi:regulator of replication initiation timing